MVRSSLRTRLMITAVGILMVSMIVILGLIWLVGLAEISPIEVSVLSGQSGSSTAIHDLSGSVDVVGDRPRWDLLQLALALLALMFVVAVTAAWLMNRRMFQRIEQITTVAHALDEHRLGVRFETNNANDEVDRMAIAINAALDRLQSGFERQRMFVRSASHELRTPLTVARTALEMPLVEGRVPVELMDDLHDALNAQSQLEQLLDTLLLLSRGDADAPRLLALDDILRKYVGQEQQRDGIPPIDWRLNLEPVTAIVGPMAFEIAMTNLLSNAVNHNREQGWCELDLYQVNDGITIRLENTGEPVTAEMLEQLTQPFVRRGASTGSGLGLAVVEQMVAAMNGTIVIATRSEGGLCVVLTLPHHQDEQQEENADE